MHLPDLVSNPTTDKDLDHNYHAILSIYIDVIEKGYWDKALKKQFEGDSELTWDGETTLQTQIALKTLKTYIKRFKV